MACLCKLLRGAHIRSSRIGVPNPSDNCTLVANASQCDSDSDGYGNHCDGDLNNNTFTNAQDYIFF